MKKKLFLGLGSIAAVAAPVAAVISCGDEDATLPKYGAYSGVKGDVKVKTDDAETNIWFVTDGGAIDDKSFNETSLKGTQEASGETDDTKNVEKPTKASEILASYQNAKSKNAKLIVASGFNHASAVQEFAASNPAIAIVAIDFTSDALKSKEGAEDEKVQQGNIASGVFNMKAPSFLEGVVAAKAAAADGMKHKIGVYGGMDIPPVTDYIEGFKAGIKYYNDHNDIKDGAQGTDIEIEDGGFVGNFNTGGQSATIAKSLISKDIDFAMAVGGPQYSDLKTAITAANKETKIIGVDTDLAQADTTVSSIVFGSIIKGLDVVTKKLIDGIVADPATSQLGKIYTGTLQNGDVSINNEPTDEAWKLPDGKTWNDVETAAKALK